MLQQKKFKKMTWGAEKGDLTQDFRGNMASFDNINETLWDLRGKVSRWKSFP